VKLTHDAFSLFNTFLRTIFSAVKHVLLGMLNTVNTDLQKYLRIQETNQWNNRHGKISLHNFRSHEWFLTRHPTTCSPSQGYDVICGQRLSECWWQNDTPYRPEETSKRLQCRGFHTNYVRLYNSVQRTRGGPPAWELSDGSTPPHHKKKKFVTICYSGHRNLQALVNMVMNPGVP
jgi:hypothetical protein